MIDISHPISEPQQRLQTEAGQPEPSALVKKGGKNSKGAMGVFARLLAGLRKNLNAGTAGGVEKAESAATIPKNRALSQTKNAKPGDKLLASLKTENPKKSGKEELVASKKGEKAKAKAENEALAGQVVLGNKNQPEANIQNEAEFDPAGENAIGLKAGSNAEPKAGEKAAANENLKLYTAKNPEKAEASVVPGGEQIQPRAKPSQEKAPAEPKGRDRKKAAIEVRDLRSGEEGAQNLSAGRESAAGPVREINVELREAGGNAVFRGGGYEKAEFNGSGAEESFESVLARQLSAGELPGDIVKQATIVLRDGNAGTIQLNLKPETLGKVKIRLEMAENKISGHIFVESEEALRAFEREIHTLEQAFRDSGFSEASLDTALGSEQRQKEEQARPFFSQRFAAGSYDAGTEGIKESGYVSGGFSVINMLA